MLCGGETVPVNVYEKDDFVLTPEAVETAVTPRSKVLLLNSPCNPTGGVLSPEATEKLAKLAIEHDLFVVSDEVYRSVLFDGASYTSIASLPGMQALRLKVVDPRSCLTWSIGQIHAGKSSNVVPEDLSASGTIRFFDISNGRRFWEEFGRTVDELGKLYRCHTKLICRQILEPTINDPACRRLFLDAVEKNLGGDALMDWGPWMASESFSYMVLSSLPQRRCCAALRFRLPF